MTIDTEGLAALDTILASLPGVEGVDPETPTSRRFQHGSASVEVVVENGALQFAGTLTEHNGNLEGLMPAIDRANQAATGVARFAEADNYIRVSSHQSLPASPVDIESWLKEALELTAAPAARSLRVNYASE